MSKFHINKNGVPAPCRAQSGNCPLGGDESHFDTQEEAQTYADKENEREHGLLPGMKESNNPVEGNYVGNYYKISQEAGDNLSKPMNSNNVKEIFDGGFKDGDMTASFEKYPTEESPIVFKAQVSKVGDNEYRVNGTIAEHSYVERDFDTREDYEEYLEGEPEVHEVNYKFTGDELKDALIEHEMIDGEIHKNQTPPAILSGLYNMSRDKIR